MLNLKICLQKSTILAVVLSTSLSFSDLLTSSRRLLPQAQALQFPPSGNRGSPKATTGGGTRGDENTCISNDLTELPLIALMPNRENSSRTATATPTLYLYVPQTTANTGEFLIADGNGQTIYYVSFAIPQKEGIVKIPIPAQAALKPNQTYSWSFMIVCNQERRNLDKFVQGELEYIQLPVEQQQKLQAAKGLEQAKLSATASLWPETLEALAQIRLNQPQEWLELLKSVGLEDLANQTFLECCKPQ